MIGPALKIGSLLVTAGLLSGAWAIGGGLPLSPAQLARETEAAAQNARRAARNSAAAANDTEALAAIARNVRTQLDASSRLLDTQLEIEASSHQGVAAARALTARVEEITAALTDLATRLRRLSRLSATSGERAVASSGAAARLDDTLDALRSRFDKVVEESRELNRKAQAFGKLRP